MHKSGEDEKEEQKSLHWDSEETENRQRASYKNADAVCNLMKNENVEKMLTKKRSPLVLRRRELEQDRFRGCNVTKGLPPADNELDQVAKLVQQIGRALAVRLCEQLPPHRKYHKKEGRDVDHEAQIHLQRLTRYGIQAVVRHVPVGMQ